ncbi:hypothetical protein JCM33374_g6090 [Metschnikowia sp. JCM 33374]|nr:hypothetical protein JCM33374_g6090 [Metschnikowia sp. JCM 33374]
MQIKFRDLKKQTVEIDADPADTVLATKEKVAALKEVDASQLKFVYSGKVLADEKKLSDFKIKDGDSVITMVSKKKTATPVAAEPPVSTPAKSAGESPATPAPAPAPSTAADAAPATAAPAAEAPAASTSAAEPATTSDFYAAVEYLLTGIPETLQPPQAPAATVGESDAPNDESTQHLDGESGTESGAANAQHENLFDAAAAASTEDGAHDQGIEMSEEGQLSMLREAIQSHPELIQPLLERMAAADPQAAALIEQDPVGFVQRFLEGDSGMELDEGDIDADAADEQEGIVRVELTEQDQQAIARLCELGFDRNLVIQVYMACDKNEEVTADILFRDT